VVVYNCFSQGKIIVTNERERKKDDRAIFCPYVLPHPVSTSHTAAKD
jgi:hypothetical protein